MAEISKIGEFSRKEERRKRIGGIVIISILLLSTLGFAISMVGFGGNGSGNSNNDDIQGFSYNGQYWVYTAGSQKYYFTTHPNEINYSYSSRRSLGDFTGKQLYIDSEIPSGLQEIYANLGSYAGKISEACYGVCERDLPERNCSENLIVARESEIESISEQENCAFINGSIKTIDAFLYKILGIN